MVEKFITSKLTVPGTHHWPMAPTDVFFLGEHHRHLFVIRAMAKVKHGDRDIEFFTLASKINAYLDKTFKRDAYTFKFGAMSCEMIAEAILNAFPECCEVSVSEDDECTGTARRV